MACARHVWLGIIWVVLLGAGCTFITIGITSRDWIQNDNASIPVPPEPDLYHSCTSYGCAALDYKVCSSCYNELTSELLCDAKTDSTGDKVCGWLVSAGSCVGCDMLTSDTLCNATTNCAWDADETACKSSYEANATSPPSNTWGIACSAGKQQAVAGFHSCGLWQYSTSPVSTSEGLTCTDGSLMQNLFGSSGDRDASVCVTSFGATLGTSNRAGNPNQLWSIASSLATSGMAFMWLAFGGGYLCIFYRDLVVWNRYLPGIATVLCTTGMLLFFFGMKDAVPTNATRMNENIFQELEVCKVCRGAGPMSSGTDCHLGLGSLMMIVGCGFCLVSSILGYYIPDAAEDLPPPKLIERIKQTFSPKKVGSKGSGKVAPMGVSRGKTPTSTTSSARKVKVLAAEKATVLADRDVDGATAGGADGLMHDCELCKTRTKDGRLDTTVNQWYCTACWVAWEASTAAARVSGGTTGNGNGDGGTETGVDSAETKPKSKKSSKIAKSSTASNKSSKSVAGSAGAGVDIAGAPRSTLSETGAGGASAAATTAVAAEASSGSKPKGSVPTTVLENPRTPAEIRTTTASAGEGGGAGAAQAEDARTSSPAGSAELDTVSIAFSITSALSAENAAILGLGDESDSDDTDSDTEL